MPVSYTIECTLCEHSIVTNEETEQADVPQNEHPPVFLSYRKLRFHTIRNAPRGFFFMCMSGGVIVLTLQQIRKAIFPAVSLPENPAKK